MKWYKGYIEAAGNILLGAKRENGEFLPVEGIEVYVNPFTGTAIKALKHVNKMLDKTITTYEILVAGDSKLFVFPEFIEVDPFYTPIFVPEKLPEIVPEPEKTQDILSMIKPVIKRRGKK